jgi:hypothetical protein
VTVPKRKLPGWWSEDPAVSRRVRPPMHVDMADSAD